MERHATTKNPPETIKVPLQRLSKSGKTVFAYMRRSTKKQEQAESLLQQEEGVKLLADKLGFDISEIRSFAESRSGFENRTRPEWSKMITEIDRELDPILLCRDSSRLSRNPGDNIQIADRLFGDNNFKGKPKFSSIFMLSENLEIIEWNAKSDKETIVTELHNNYLESLKTKKKSNTGHLLKLTGGDLPYASPHGLTRVIDEGIPYKKILHKGKQTALMENEKMPFIKKAFEMKAGGKIAKDISRYLKKFGGFYIAPRKIVETIISNTVYKGLLFKKDILEPFRLRFWTGRPPIGDDLWEKANQTVGKRGSGFGEGQLDHLFVGNIKTEGGAPMSLYISKGRGKGRYYNYVARIGTGRKAIEISISEIKLLTLLKKELRIILKELFKEIDILSLSQTLRRGKSTENKKLREGYENDQSHYEELKKDHEYWKQEYQELEKRSGLYPSNEHEEALLNISNILQNTEESLVASKTKMTETWEGIIKQVEEKHAIDNQKRDHIIVGLIEKSPFFRGLVENSKAVQKAVLQLEEQKRALENEIRDGEIPLMEKGFNADQIKRYNESKIQQIRNIDRWIEDSKNEDNILEMIERLPHVLADVLELTYKPLQEGNTEVDRTKIKQILDMMVLELIVTNKKELKVKLIPGLSEIKNEKKGTGATYGTRTHDLPLTMGMLYQLS